MTEGWKLQKLIDAVWDVLKECPRGATLTFMAELIGCKEHHVRRAIRKIRQSGKYGNAERTIECVPNGQRKKWIFRIVEGHKLVDAERSPWLNIRIGDCYEREKVISGVAYAAVADTDGRTREGRLARLVFNNYDHSVRQAELVQEIFQFDR